MTTALHAVVALGEIGVALPVAYLCALALAALVAQRWRRTTPEGGSRASGATRLAVLIPAHDEATMIATLLASLKQQTYPAAAFDVWVIADNCTDATAAVAASAGARVLERHDATRRGKGYALNWALAQLDARASSYAGYVVIDADSVVEPPFLAAMAAQLASGAAACQATNTVLNTAESPSTVLRWLALTLMNHVRPLGRTTLGSTSTLTGNGMCLSAGLLARHPWQAFGIAEDYQYYLSVVTAGERVRYVPQAVVRSHMPTSFEQMQSQDIRWESAAPETPSWKAGLGLLRAGLRAHDLVRLEALAELLAPTLSQLLAEVALIAVAAAIFGTALERWLALALIAGAAIYCGSALVMLRARWPVYRALLYAPGYLGWKLWVQLVLRRSKRRNSEWVRTQRPAETAAETK